MKKITLLNLFAASIDYLVISLDNLFHRSNYNVKSIQNYIRSRTINQNTRHSFVPIVTDPAYSLQLILSEFGSFYFQSAGLTADYENGILYFAGDNTESGIASWDISNQDLNWRKYILA